MDEKLVQELLDEFIPTMESLEAQSTAAIQFLKDQKAGNEKKLAPYLENAAKASNVKWLAVRLRLAHLISYAVKNAERAEEEKPSEQKSSTEKKRQRKKRPKQSPRKRRNLKLKNKLPTRNPNLKRLSYFP